MRPKILVLADVPNWAWAKKAEQLKRYLSDDFDIDIAFLGNEWAPRGYDLYHTFEVSQIHQHGLTRRAWGKLATGITAHVWRTWDARHGEGTVRRWASEADAFHANSKLLQAEMESYLGGHVYYVPNGVDESFFKRLRPRQPSERLVVGHVGKPNPRKGRDLIFDACRLAGVEFREIRRTSKDALSSESVRDFYQDLHVLAVASDMDGTPNPALEAAACEVAVVSNRIGNMPEFVDDSNGLLVERSVEDLVKAFRSISPDRAIEMGLSARKTVETSWSWSTMAQNYGQMWKAMLG